MKWLWRVVRASMWLVALLVVGGGITAWLYARQATPRVDGEMVLPSVRAELRIERDEHGIPTIRAASIRDAMYGVGVVHAQDRLWQLETHRRIGSGRVAEAFGEPALETDKFLRALGVKRIAEKQWAQTQGEAREALEAYTAGINDVLMQQTKARPPEMLMLGLAKEPWTPADSLAWAIMMAYDLGGNWHHELQRMRMALKVPTDRVHQAIPPYPGDQPLTTTDFAALYRGLKLDGTQAANEMSDVLDRMLAVAPPSGVEGVGSNNWVLAGSHTTTGKPMLANDPHLKLSTPALWYFVRLEAPGLSVAGATMPGMPMVVLGQNQKLAWGFTNTNPDVQDLYLERIDPGNPNQYQTPTGSALFDQVEEIIKVKGKPDVKFVARASRHGPLISDAGLVDDVLGTKGKQAYALAMRWTALDVDVDPMGLGLNIMRAESLKALVASTRSWVAPMQNIAVADQSGAIGFVAPGRVPLRGPDNDLKGQVPAPGWEAKYDWVGMLDVDQTPREFDPPRGWIATANQRIHPTDFPHYITADWAVPFRQQRIEQMLEAKPKHSLDDLRAMQADVKSLAPNTLLPWLQKAQSSHALAAAAQVQLKGFDGTMAADKAAPAIFWAWLRHLTQALMEDELGQEMFDKISANRQFRDATEGILARDDAWWCDDKTTKTVAETCAQQNDAAFTRALDELQAQLGGDVSAWRWGTLHQSRAEHRPFSRVKPLAKLFELRTPVGGDTFTVNVSRVNYKADATTGERYLTEHGPSLRALYDVGDVWQSRFMHSSGQSGLVWSAHYRDFVEPWARVDYVPVWGVKGAVPRATLLIRKGG